MPGVIFKFRPLADYPPIVQHLRDTNNEGLLARLINSFTQYSKFDRSESFLINFAQKIGRMSAGYN